MKKWIVWLLLAGLLLTGCASRQMSEAEKLLEKGDYQAALTILETVDSDSERYASLLKKAKAGTAFVQTDFRAVYDLLGVFDQPDPAMDYMQKISWAHVALEEQDYADVVEILEGVDGGRELAIYIEGIKGLIAEAVKELDVDYVLELLEESGELEETVVSTVSGKCEALEYDAFLFLDELIEALPKGKLKEQLTEYADDHGIERAKAFLNGVWELQIEEDDFPQVELHMFHDDSSIGIMIDTGNLDENYHYSVGDVFWKDFVFLSDNSYTCYNLTRYSDGAAAGADATVTIDFENGLLNLHLTSKSGITSYPDRVWKKIS